MVSGAYKKWLELYDENLLDIWNKERPELKEVSMVLYVLKKEFTRVQNEVDLELSCLKQSLQEKEKLILSLSPSKRDNEAKENVRPLETIQNVNIKKEPPLEVAHFDISEVIRSNSSSSSFCCNTSSDKDEVLSSSPTINKNKKLTFFKKHKLNSNVSTPKNDETSVSPSCIKPKIAVNLAESDFKTPVQINLLKNIDGSKTNDLVEGNEDILECSIIENTPEVSKSKWHKSSKSSTVSFKNKIKKSKKNSKCTKNKGYGTLTQMIKDLNDKECEDKKQQQRSANTDSTFFDNLDDHMDIDDILQVANATAEGSKTDSIAEKTGCGANDTTCLDINAKIPKRYLVSQKFIDNYDRLPEKKAEDLSKPYKETVRGNAKKALPGWSCPKCEEFYKAFNLPPEELQKKIDACSKHRSKFKPLDDTYSGFWDVTMPPTPDYDAISNNK